MTKEYAQKEILRYENWIAWCHEAMKKVTMIDGEKTKVNMFRQIEWAKANMKFLNKRLESL